MDAMGIGILLTVSGDEGTEEKVRDRLQKTGCKPWRPNGGCGTPGAAVALDVPPAMDCDRLAIMVVAWPAAWATLSPAMNTESTDNCNKVL